MTQNFQQILAQTWRLIWRNKILWFFGLFVALITQEIEIVLRNQVVFSDQTLSVSSWKELFTNGFGGVFSSIWSSLTDSTASAIIGSLIALMILALFVWLMVASVGALTHSIAQLDAGKKISFNGAMANGHKYFWKNIVIILLAKVVDYGVLILMAVLVSLMLLHAVGLWLGALLAVISFIVSLIVSFVARYAAGYVVVNNENTGRAILSGWKLFIKNWVDSIEMAILIFLINLVANLAILLVIALIILPFFIIILVMNSGGYTTTANFIFGAAVALVLAIVIITGSLLSSFQFSAWVTTFLRLKEGHKPSWILRLAGRVSGQKK
ncbi:MAG: hypothetical protein WC734_02925 [Patescibacteria group bacterium]|jgi:hypothetical protein